MALICSKRSGLYTFCVLAIFLATILYIISFLAPYWQRNHPHKFWQGIWYSCSDDGSCRRFDASEEYMKAVRILQILGFIGLVAACFFVIFSNCRTKDIGHTRTVEVVTLVAALIGFSGPMVYLGYWRRDVEGSDGLLSFAWAFALNIAACALAIIAALVLFFANRELPGASNDSDLGRPLQMEWDRTWERPKSEPAYVPGHAVVPHHRLPPYDAYGGAEFPTPGGPAGRYAPDYPADYPYRSRSPYTVQGRHTDTFPIYPDYPTMPPTRAYIVASPTHPRGRYLEEAGTVYTGDVGRYYEPDDFATAGPARMMPVVLPRLIIRGQHEPGYGYQEYRYQ